MTVSQLNREILWLCYTLKMKKNCFGSWLLLEWSIFRNQLSSQCGAWCVLIWTCIFSEGTRVKSSKTLKCNENILVKFLVTNYKPSIVSRTWISAISGDDSGCIKWTNSSLTRAPSLSLSAVSNRLLSVFNNFFDSSSASSPISSGP